MNVIQPNCRIQFTAEDIDFIVSTLCHGAQDGPFLTQLLAAEDTRDQILDDNTLFQRLMEHRGCLPVSDHLYFYVVVRHVLKETGIEDRRVADYVAEMLCEFSRQDRTRCNVPGQPASMDYVFEMLAALKEADDRTSFYLRAHIGNHSLFLAGVFPERIRRRAELRGFPDVSYYEAMGQANFRAASDHRLAGRYELVPIFATLSECFHNTRVALNDVSQRLFALDEPLKHIDAMLINLSGEKPNL